MRVQFLFTAQNWQVRLWLWNRLRKLLIRLKKVLIRMTIQMALPEGLDLGVETYWAFHFYLINRSL